MAPVTTVLAAPTTTNRAICPATSPRPKLVLVSKEFMTGNYGYRPAFRVLVRARDVRADNAQAEEDRRGRGEDYDHQGRIARLLNPAHEPPDEHDQSEQARSYDAGEPNNL